jgi:hypothetical protein
MTHDDRPATARGDRPPPSVLFGFEKTIRAGSTEKMIPPCRATSFRLAAVTLVAACILFASLLVPKRSASAAAAPWLFVTDIHLKANYRHAPPSRLGDDTDQELFNTTIAEMRRLDPNPPVVVVVGDLLAHIIDRRATVPTTQRIAASLDRAFPHAQFLCTW